VDIVRIHGLELDCIVGLRPQERVQAQRVRVDIALATDTKEAGHSGRIAAALDYDRITEDVAALLKFRRYRLIEMATEELAAMLLAAHPSAQWTRLRVEKPFALAGRARAASVEVQRNRDANAEIETHPSWQGTTRLALRTRDAELWMLELKSGQTLSATLPGLRSLDRVVQGQLLAEDGQVWAAGLPAPDIGPAGHWRVHGAPARVFRCVLRT
jgi:FolB domain-containing protein